MAKPPYVPPYADHADAIPNDTILVRRVPPDFIDWDVLDRDGRPRITAGAFQDYGKKLIAARNYPAPAMSVALAPILEEDGIAPQQLLADYGPTYGIARFAAGLARQNNQGVQADPIPTLRAHALVFSMVARKRSGEAMEGLAAGAKWEIPPTARP